MKSLATAVGASRPPGTDVPNGIGKKLQELQSYLGRRDIGGKAPWIVAIAFILALGCWANISRHLQLSSDEVYFYYSSHYPSIAQGKYHAEMVNRLMSDARRRLWV